MPYKWVSKVFDNYHNLELSFALFSSSDRFCLKNKDHVIIANIGVVPILQIWLAGKEKSYIKVSDVKERRERRKERCKKGGENKGLWCGVKYSGLDDQFLNYLSIRFCLCKIRAKESLGFI